MIALRDLKKLLKAEKDYGLSLNIKKCELCFVGQTTNTQYNTIIAQFEKLCPKIKTKFKDELVILGCPIGESCQKELLKKSS